MKKWQLSTHGADPSAHSEKERKKERKNRQRQKQADKYPFLYVPADSHEEEKQRRKLTSRIYELLVAHKQDCNQTKEFGQC